MVKEYLKRNFVPLAVELIFVVSCFIVPREYFIYTNCLFYLALFCYFLRTRDFVLKEWVSSFRGGKGYWGRVALTCAAFFLAFAVTILLEGFFPNLDTGNIALRRNSWGTLIIFFISTVLLPAITEETFFRKNLILLDNKRLMLITTAFSMLLYALEHSLSWWGIILTMIWALPLSVAYIRTKNIHIVMTAHFIGNLMGNGADVVLGAARLLGG